MNRIQTYLDDTLSGLLADYAEKNGCSVSHAAGKIIASYLMSEDQAPSHRVENKQQFLRLMNVLNQVLTCVYDADKVTVESKSAKECLESIKKSVLNLAKD